LASIIIVARNAAAVLPSCLANISAGGFEPIEVIVVDNASSDNTSRVARASSRVALCLSHSVRRSYASAVNSALPHARGLNIILMEPEAIPGPAWLTGLLSELRNGVGAVGPVSNGLNGRQNLLKRLPDAWRIRDVDELLRALREDVPASTEDVDLLQPLCVLVPMRILAEGGGLNEAYQSTDGALLDLYRRLRADGLTLRVAGASFVARSGGMRPTGGAIGETDAFAADMQILNEHGAAGSHRPPMSVVIPVCNQLDFTRRCLDTLTAGSRSDMEIMVVDNGSSDGSTEYLTDRGDVTVIRNETNLGFAAAVNQGLREARGQFLLVLNNDVVVPERMIERLLDTADSNRQYGLIGAVTNWAAPSQQVEAGYEDLSGLESFAEQRWTEYGDTLRHAEMLIGFCMLIRRDVIDTIGLFDEAYGVGNFEDNDLSLRASLAGFKLGIADGVYLHHFGGRTFAGEGFDYGALMQENHRRFLAKWGDLIEPAGAGPETAEVHSPTPSDPSIAPVDAPAASDPVPDAPGASPSPDAAEADPAPGDLYLIANDRFEKGEFGEAADIFTWITTVMPEMTLAHMGLGLAEAKLGKFEEAIVALEKCVELEPTFSEGFNNLGVVYQIVGRTEDARNALRRAIELDPENRDAADNLEAMEVAGV